MTKEILNTAIAIALIAASVFCRHAKIDSSTFDMCLAVVVGGIFGLSVPGANPIGFTKQILPTSSVRERLESTQEAVEEKIQTVREATNSDIV